MLAKPYSRLLWVLFAVFWVFYTFRVLMLNGLLNIDIESHPAVLLYLSGLVVLARRRRRRQPHQEGRRRAFSASWTRARRPSSNACCPGSARRPLG
jgi:hypothetical protein